MNSKNRQGSLAGWLSQPGSSKRTGVLKAFSIFHLPTLKSEVAKADAKVDSCAINELYTAQFKELVDHFGKATKLADGTVVPPLIDEDAAFSQWTQFKYLLTNPDLQVESIKNKWSDLVEEGLKDAFSEVFKLANVSLVLPLSTATVERGFSKMDIVKIR